MLNRRLSIVDVSNLYYSVLKRHGKKLNYRKFKEFCGDATFRAYSSSMRGEGNTFLKILKNLDFDVRIKPVRRYHANGVVTEKANCDIEMVVDTIKDMATFDTLVLASGDGDMIPFVKYLQEHGKYVAVVGCAINSDLRVAANEWLEIGEDYLE